MARKFWQLAPQIRLRPEAKSALLFNPLSAETLWLDMAGLKQMASLVQGRSSWHPRKRLFQHYLHARGFIRRCSQAPNPTSLLDCMAKAQTLIPPHNALSAPEALHISLTDACNQHCSGCFFSNQTADTPNRYMPFTRFKNLLDQAAQAQVFQVALGGGEPLMHPQLIDMVAYAAQKGVLPNLTTNGYLLAQDLGATILTELKDAGLGQIQFSLNGSTAELHEATRPHFEAVIQALKWAQKLKLRWGINCLVTPQNITELEALIRLAESMGAAHFNLLRPKPGMGTDWLPQHNLSLQHTRWLQKQLPHWQRRYRLMLTTDTSFSFLRQGSPQHWEQNGLGGCSAGRRILTVQVDGRFSPCSHIPMYDRADDLMSIWQNSAHLAQFRSLEETLTGQCQSCAFKAVCRGCRAVVLSQSNNFNQTDSLCPRHQPIS